MKHTLLIITALLFITSTVIPQSKVNINNLSDYGGKMFKENDDKPYTGLVFDLYRTTGNKSLEGRYKDGLRNGKWSWWNVDNKMDSSGTYKDGNLNGKWTYWNENGQKRSEKKYKDGVPDGKWTEWSGGEGDPNDYSGAFPYHKSYEETYKDGSLDGLHTEWNENGQKRIQKIYKNGIEIEWTEWEYYDNGQKKSEGTLKDGELDGLWTIWYENGQKKVEVTFKNGKLHGVSTVWYENGQKGAEETWKDGKEDGKWTDWYENGQKGAEVTWKDGKPDKLGTQWFENGQKSVVGTYKDEMKDGLWTIWYENGQKSEERTYKNGKLDGKRTEWHENGQKSEERTYKNGEVITDKCWDEDGNEIDCHEFGMVFVEGGTFEMGSNSGYNDEKPVHSVTVSDFNISKTEVTFEQYDVFCNATGRARPADRGWGRGDRPVIYVRWDEAVAYCEWMNKASGKTYRLPTEAEWEYAARGGNKSKGYRYSGSNDISDVGWYYYNSGGKTHPVAQKQPNELGLYDMSGNVYEWCSDWYGEESYSSSPQNNPQEPSSGSHRVLRGGSWHNFDTSCRVADRGSLAPVRRYIINGIWSGGFRLVLSQD